MMKKVTGYRLQVTGFLIAVVFVMFVAPATASAAPTASIRAGQGDTFTATANGTNLTKIDIYRTPTGYASWTYMGTGSCSGSTCSYSVSWDPSSSGTRDWYFVVNAFDSTGQCTGNPFPFGPSWSDCGSNDYTGMTPPPATSPSNSCPSPGTTASVSWTGVSGATRYDVFAFDLSYGSPNWSACGSNGLVVCQQVTSGTSYSFSTTAGKNYQWYVYACNGWGCSSPASYSTTFTCAYPNCNTNLDCVLCSVPSNTCSTNNGTQTCYYRAYTGGGTCNVTSFNQSCTRSNCSSGYSCDSSGNCIPPPPTPTIVSNSCPAPGTTASVSWNAVSGASRYDVFAFDLSYGSPNWSACGSNGLVVCQQVTSGTSYSFSTTPGKNYQWFVSACNSAGCSPTATSTFTCTPPNCNTNLDCVLCSVPSNTCSTNNGTQTCYYRAYTGGGTCNVTSFNQSCTRSNCSSGYSCDSSGNCIPPPPTASISAPANGGSATISQATTISATANGTNLTKVNIYRAPASSDLTLAASWTQIAENASCSGSTCSLNSSWTPTAGEGGQWVIAVNAFDSYDQRCSGMPSTRGGYWTADCNRNGSTSNVTINVTPPAPTNPSASCPIPGTIANLSWTGVSGASRYDVFAFDLAYGAPNWSSSCGSNGRVVCQQVTSGTSYSFATTAGRNYQWFVFACNSAGCSSAPASYSTTFSCLYNNAQYVSQSCPPSNMSTGQTANVSVIMNNNGNTTWPASSTYRLGSQNPQDNPYWGGRITPSSGTSPGGSYAFSSTVTAPSTPGTYNFQWRMVQEGVEWFGETTPNCSITVAYPPPRASVSGLSAATVGYTATLTATLTGSARSGQIWITKGDGRSTFSCPQGPNGAPYLASTGFYWCPVARQDNTTSLSGAYQFAELGTYTTVVNAFSSTNQTGTGPSDQCSGTPSSLGFNSSIWSDCGSSDTFTTAINRPPTPSGSVGASCTPEATISWANSDPAITYVDISEDNLFPVGAFYNKYVAGSTSTSTTSGFNLYPGGTTPLILKPNTTYYLRSWNGYDISYPPSSFRTNDCPPRASVSGPDTMIVGNNLTYTASLTGSARSGQIWITKGDGRSTFSCPGGPNGAPYLATSGFYWCPVARQDNTTSLSGTYTFAEPGSYTTVVNAFSNPYQLGTGPSDECTGTPTSLGLNSSIWSDCGTNDNIVTINAAPRASVTGPEIGTKGLASTFTATLTGGAQSGQIWITKGDGRSVFPCPTTIYFASTGRFWCGIGNGTGSTITGTYTFVEPGTYTTVVNAFANTLQTGTNPSDECTGTPSELGINPSAWSDCGTSDNVVTIISSGPAASLTGSSRGTVGAPTTFTATLLGSAQSAQIWITKGDGRSNFYCNGAENNAYRASTGYYWCNIGSGAGLTVTGSYTFPDTDRYTAVVNAYNSTNQTGNNPTNQCTGTPTYLGFNSSTWSDCGANDFVIVTSSAPTATNCGGGTSPRAEGLVTSPSLETGSRFGTTTTGRCVVDSATEFSPFKIPSYEDLKFIYYTQSKATKTEITPSSGTANQGTLRSALNNYDTALIKGNLDIGANLGGASKTAVVFVDGDLNIDTPTFTFGDASSGLVFVVGGNVIINRSVTRIDAVIISGGTIYTADGCSTRNSVDAQQLIVNGSLVSLDTGNIVFCRNLSDNLLPAEKINSDPKYLVILRNLYADTVQRWSEIP